MKSFIIFIEMQSKTEQQFMLLLSRNNRTKDNESVHFCPLKSTKKSCLQAYEWMICSGYQIGENKERKKKQKGLSWSIRSTKLTDINEIYEYKMWDIECLYTHAESCNFIVILLDERLDIYFFIYQSHNSARKKKKKENRSIVESNLIEC